MLTDAHKAEIVKFIRETFDVRVQLAEKHRLFAELPAGEKRARVMKWAQHYGKMAYNLLKHPPEFRTGYGEVMALFKQHSSYYNKY
jgi:hypothetical protein